MCSTCIEPPDAKRSTTRLGDGFRALFNAQVPALEYELGRRSHDRGYPQVMLKVQGCGRPRNAALSRALLDERTDPPRGGSRRALSLTAISRLLFLVEGLETRRILEGEESDRADIDRKLTVLALKVRRPRRLGRTKRDMPPQRSAMSVAMCLA